jgi:hypothetical protein
MGSTETLAQFVVDTHLCDIPSKAAEISKLVILDVLGVASCATMTLSPTRAEQLGELVDQLGNVPGHRCFDDTDEWRRTHDRLDKSLREG